MGLGQGCLASWKRWILGCEVGLLGPVTTCPFSLPEPQSSYQSLPQEHSPLPGGPTLQGHCRPAPLWAQSCMSA